MTTPVQSMASALLVPMLALALSACSDEPGNARERVGVVLRDTGAASAPLLASTAPTAIPKKDDADVHYAP